MSNINGRNGSGGNINTSQTQTLPQGTTQADPSLVIVQNSNGATFQQAALQKNTPTATTKATPAPAQKPAAPVIGTEEHIAQRNKLAKAAEARLGTQVIEPAPTITRPAPTPIVTQAQTATTPKPPEAAVTSQSTVASTERKAPAQTTAPTDTKAPESTAAQATAAPIRTPRQMAVANATNSRLGKGEPYPQAAVTSQATKLPIVQVDNAIPMAPPLTKAAPNLPTDLEAQIRAVKLTPASQQKPIVQVDNAIPMAPPLTKAAPNLPTDLEAQIRAVKLTPASQQKPLAELKEVKAPEDLVRNKILDGVRKDYGLDPNSSIKSNPNTPVPLSPAMLREQARDDKSMAAVREGYLSEKLQQATDNATPSVTRTGPAASAPSITINNIFPQQQMQKSMQMMQEMQPGMMQPMQMMQMQPMQMQPMQQMQGSQSTQSFANSTKSSVQEAAPAQPSRSSAIADRYDSKIDALEEKKANVDSNGRVSENAITGAKIGLGIAVILALASIAFPPLALAAIFAIPAMAAVGAELEKPGTRLRKVASRGKLIVRMI